MSFEYRVLNGERKRQVRIDLRLAKRALQWELDGAKRTGAMLLIVFPRRLTGAVISCLCGASTGLEICGKVLTSRMPLLTCIVVLMSSELASPASFARTFQRRGDWRGPPLCRRNLLVAAVWKSKTSAT